MKIDLHMHSYHSDGKLNCEDLLKEVMIAGIGMFSLTDHDTIEGLKEMKEAVKDKEILFIPGVEVATRYLGDEYHLTVYGYDEQNEAFLDLMAEIKKIRTDYDRDIIQFLSPQVDLEDFLNYEDDPYLGGWPSLNYLIKKGVIEDIKGYFKISEACSAQMIFPSPERVIEVAHGAGAAVFLAHPSSNAKDGLPYEKLDFFREAGIDGLECYSPYSKSPEAIAYYKAYCKKYGLKVSGGSDYHGDFIGRQLGEPHVTSDDVSFEFLKQFIWKK